MRTEALLDAKLESLVLRLADGTDVPVCASPRYDDEEQLREQLTQAVESRPSSTSSAVVLRLHVPLVQVRALPDLPPVSGRDLGRLVAGQRERFFRPMQGEGVVAVAWCPSDAAPRVVRAALAPRRLLECLERCALAAGLRVVDIRVVVPAEGEPTLRLPSPRLARAARRRSRVTLGAMLGLASLGWVGAGAAYLVDLAADDRRVRRELEALEPSLAQLAAVEERLASFAPVAGAMARQSAVHERVTAGLSRLVLSLPGDTHLHRVVLERSGRMTVEAHGADPVRTVEALGRWWPGPVRLDGAASKGAAAHEPYTLVLEVTS